MVLEYIDSPISFHSTHASDKSEEMKSSQKYKRISIEKRKLLLEKIFFENKKIKKAAKELNLNYSSAKTILHLYRKKIKKPKSDENFKDAKRCGFSVANPKLHLKQVEIVATQGGRDLKDIFFTHRTVSILPQVPELPELPKMRVKEESQIEKDGRSFVEKFLFYKELERKISVEEEKIINNVVFAENAIKTEEKNKSLFRRAIIIKPIDPIYAFHK